MSDAKARGVQRFREEHGAVAVLFGLTVIVLFAAVAFVIDISRLYHARQVLQNAVDFGALAAAQELPVQGATQGAAAETIARRVAIANAPQLSGGGLGVSYKCVVGDRDQNSVPDAGEVPFICGPSSGTWSPASWTYKGKRAAHICNPAAGDKCNTIRLTTSEDVNYFFAPVIGISSGNTGAVNAASCKGACGAASSPVDVVMVLDRTGSMSNADVDNVRNAALSVLDFYEPAEQWIGMVSLPYGQPGNKCEVYGDRRPSPPNPSPVRTYQLYPNSTASDWQNAALSDTYKNSSGLNPADELVQQITCLERARDWQGTTGDRVYARSEMGTPVNAHTNLGDPLDAAREMLANQGRPEVPDVIIFMTDGQANQPSTMEPCTYFNNKATLAKNEGQTIFTIAYGLDNSTRCPDNDGPIFRNRLASFNMAMAATQPTFDEWPGTCNTNENRDGDWYFCAPATADLEPVFRQVAAAAIETSHLVDDF